MNDPQLTELDCQLQRLADGELGEEESREVLRQLDRLPDGWRRCATTFLEAQLWSQELTAAPTRSPAPASRSEATAGRWALRAAGALTVAAGLTLAFLLGTRFAPLPAARPRSPEVAAPAAPSSTIDPRSRRGVGPAVPPVTLADFRELGPSLGDVTLQFGEDPSLQEVTVPVYRSSDAYDTQFLQLPTLSDGLHEKIRASGNELHRELILTRIDMGDGHVMIVPVEQIQLRPRAVRQIVP